MNLGGSTNFLRWLKSVSALLNPCHAPDETKGQMSGDDAIAPCRWCGIKLICRGYTWKGMGGYERWEILK